MKVVTAVLSVYMGFLSMVAFGASSSDTTEVNHLNQLAASFFKYNPDSAFYYAQNSIILAGKIKYTKGLADGLVQAGQVYYLRGRSDNAIQNFDKAILIYKGLNNEQGLAICYILYGRMYTLLASYQKAFEYLNLALNINKKIHNEVAITDCYKNIGNLYYSKGQLSEALDFYYKGLFIAIKNHYQLLSGELYNNIGVILQSMEVYPNAMEYYKKSIAIFEHTRNLQTLGILNQNVGEVLLSQGKNDLAFKYLTKSNVIAKKHNDMDGLSLVYADLGLYYGNKHEFKKAINTLDSSLLIGAKYRLIYNQAYTLIGFATIYNQQKQFKKAYSYAVRGQQLAFKMGILSLRASAEFQLNKTLAGLNRVNEAYRSLNEYIKLKNALNNNESIQKLTSYNLELSFQVKQRSMDEEQRRKDLLYQQNLHAQRLTILIVLIILIAMIVILGIYYREKRKQQNIIGLLKNKNLEVFQQKTDLDQQTDELNKLNALKDRLISILAHDLRAPLSTLRGLFNLLQDDSISHQELLGMIPTVLRNLEYTSDFLDTLLFWINSQMENYEKGVKRFSVNDLIAREIENYREQALIKGVTLIGNLQDQLIACADPDSVRIVVRNLIINAIKFSSENDIVEVSAIIEKEDVLIQIRDTGHGMLPEQSGQLFKSKVNSKLGTHKESGTGMGLLFCKDLVEKSNGRIWVTSQEGVGSEFSFTIPKSV